MYDYAIVQKYLLKHKIKRKRDEQESGQGIYACRLRLIYFLFVFSLIFYLFIYFDI